MFEISGASSSANGVKQKEREKKTHRASINFLLPVIFVFCVSRSGDGAQDLHLRHCRRAGQVDAADGGEEVQVDRATPEPLALRSLLPGGRRHNSRLADASARAHPRSPAAVAVSQLPCDEHWKREELKRYLLQAPIWQWEGMPIHHMGVPGCISMVHIINAQRQVTE